MDVLLLLQVLILKIHADLILPHFPPSRSSPPNPSDARSCPRASSTNERAERRIERELRCRCPATWVEERSSAPPSYAEPLTESHRHYLMVVEAEGLEDADSAGLSGCRCFLLFRGVRFPCSIPPQHLRR